MKPKIIFEDADIVVLDKPSGLQVIPAATKKDRETLTDWLATTYKEFHIVHRLDRETSGVMVVARTAAAYERIKKQFQRRETKKVYRAFVYGTIPERGTITKPIGSSRGGLGPRSAKRAYGVMREAETLYRRVAAGGGASYAEVFPKTGRTHQVRVHFAAIGHPIIADSLYAPGRPHLFGFSRLALHAFSLIFMHPITKKEVSFEAPLPPDFVAAEQMLKAQ
ncbi:hypothetical protein A2943_00800 [Candidatus Adlerbacteria bacterium RIFCSPLOWO2_01_FULL_51_16]|uniref:Pseudouridine synthase n=1 Tax=Candidatus Adlerbacteria bacterium RIFCSPLOWO2_01_FULL_51_16 TaxID=1797243 RepID=A0A1F4XHT0_9BACT|nr:MAG: hypothetical protein A2943_00800 [Candidatus Adlerbacteria bacterium RIFCSPLOWO2_01_FULL_51_16]